MTGRGGAVQALVGGAAANPLDQLATRVLLPAGRLTLRDGKDPQGLKLVDTSEGDGC